MPGYTYLRTEGGYYIYENDNYIPYGFSYDYYMTYEYCDEYEEEKRSNVMLKAMLLTDEQIEKYGHLMENIETTPLYITEDETNTTQSISDEAMAIDSANLAKTSAYYFKKDNRGFTAKVQRDKTSLVFFSVPYDDGWTATVNGKPAEIEKVNSGFMAVKVDAGDSEIRFNYMTPGLLDGIKITTVSAALLLIYMIAFLIYKKNHKPDLKYPEGDIMLKAWGEQELEEIRLTLEKEEKAGVKSDATEPNHSINNDNADINIPTVESNFKGGFKINTNAFDNENNDL